MPTSQQQQQTEFDQYVRSHPDFAAWLAAHPRPANASGQSASAPPKGNAGIVAKDVATMRSYYETRPQYNNHCGQAAIAAVLDYHQKPLGRLGMPPWDQSAAIDEIVNEGFAPDVVGGVLGTSGGLIKNAFDHFGLTNTSCGYSGAADAGWDQCWASVQNWVHAGYPVPCCVDVGTLGGQYFAGHWLIVYAIDASNVTVANWTSPTIPVNTFLAAWACHWYPYGYNHCFVTGQ